MRPRRFFRWQVRHLRFLLALAASLVIMRPSPLPAALRAGAAKVDITNREAGPVHDPLYAKALVLQNDQKTVAVITIDAVAIGGIGTIANDYMAKVRDQLQAELQIVPHHVLVNASHCHGVVCADVVERTVEAVRMAKQRLVPVRVGWGQGQENRITQNRRLLLKDGREADVRHAYALPPDDQVAAIGPIDPEIGLLRFDRLDGTPLAVIYNFACHPIQGVPSHANTADLSGLACQVIEENLGTESVVLFLQGCAGDINPVSYKDVDQPRDAEVLANRLGLSVLQAARQIVCHDEMPLDCQQQSIDLPRADLAHRIRDLELEQQRLVDNLQGTSLNFKTFVPLLIKYQLHPDFPSSYAHAYLQEQQVHRHDLANLDIENRSHLAKYMQNIQTMEALTRLQTNLQLLRKHHQEYLAAGSRTVTVELIALRVGDFFLVTFPGELTVQIGLNIKQNSPHAQTYVAGYTNGYIYYAPTAAQLKNVGGAQEDSDCILDPAWQAIFEAEAMRLLKRW